MSCQKKIFTCEKLFPIAAAAVFFAVFIISLRFGSVPVSWSSIAEFFAGTDDRLSPDSMILHDLRLPRILSAAVTGAALAVSGTILQGLLHNHLASPGIVGVSSGGGIAGLIAILFFAATPGAVMCATFAGAVICAVVICLLAWKNGIDPLRLILAGVALSTLCGAAGSAVLFLNSEKAGNVLAFTVGTLSMCRAEELSSVLPFFCCGMGVAVICARRLDILMLGDESAASLGLNVESSRLLLMFSAVLLASCGVALAGLLGFVGLVIPHFVRLLSRTSSSRRLIVRSAVAGAILVMICDTAGRSLFAPVEIPAGVVTSLIGPPFFLYLLMKKSRVL